MTQSTHQRQVICSQWSGLFYFPLFSNQGSAPPHLNPGADNQTVTVTNSAEGWVLHSPIQKLPRTKAFHGPTLGYTAWHWQAIPQQGPANISVWLQRIICDSVHALCLPAPQEGHVICVWAPACDVLSCFIHVLLFATPGTVARQAPLSMGLSRQEYWSGLPCPPPGDLPDPGIESVSLAFPALQAGSLPTEPPRKPLGTWHLLLKAV